MRTIDYCLLTPSGGGETELGSCVLRGGSWNNDNPDNFRCAYRNNNRPDNRNNNNGFRCASTLRRVRVTQSHKARPARARFSTETGACQRESRFHPGCTPRGVAEYPKGTGRLVAAQANAIRSHPCGCHEFRLYKEGVGWVMTHPTKTL